MGRAPSPQRGPAPLHGIALVGRGIENTCSSFVPGRWPSEEQAGRSLLAGSPESPLDQCATLIRQPFETWKVVAATLDDPVAARQIRAFGDPIEEALGMVDVAFLHYAALPDVNDTLALVPALPAHVYVEELVAHGDAELARVPGREDRRLVLREEVPQVDINVLVLGPQSRQEEFALHDLPVADVAPPQA